MKSKQNFLLIILLGITVTLLAACTPAVAVPVTGGASPSAQQGAAQQPAQAAVQPAQVQQPAQVAMPPAPSLSADEVYKAVDAAMAKVNTAGARHVSQTSYKGDTTETNIEADSVPPNYHQVVSAMGTVMAEQYIFDGTIYNNLQGTWTQTPGAGKSFQSALAGFSQGMADMVVRADGKVTGVEVVNGKPAIVYSYTTTLKGLKVSSSYTVWVDMASGLPVKQVIINADKMKTVQLITYNPSITLKLPDEAKNAKVGK